MPERPEQPGRNPQMQAWGDAFIDHWGEYSKTVVEPILREMAAYAARSPNPQAQEAMVQLGIWVHRMPVMVAEEISRAQDPAEIIRVSDPERTSQLIGAVSQKTVMPASLANNLRQALNNDEVRRNVAIPAAQQAGLI
jgi:hypothetical protein